MIPLESIRKDYLQAQHQYNLALDLRMDIEFYSKRYKTATEVYLEALQLEEIKYERQLR